MKIMTAFTIFIFVLTMRVDAASSYDESPAFPPIEAGEKRIVSFKTYDRHRICLLEQERNNRHVMTAANTLFSFTCYDLTKTFEILTGSTIPEELQAHKFRFQSTPRLTGYCGYSAYFELTYYGILEDYDVVRVLVPSESFLHLSTPHEGRRYRLCSQ